MGADPAEKRGPGYGGLRQGGDSVTADRQIYWRGLGQAGKHCCSERVEASMPSNGGDKPAQKNAVPARGRRTISKGISRE